MSRTEGKALVPTTVDHVAFSPTGDWMATVSLYLRDVKNNKHLPGCVKYQAAV